MDAAVAYRALNFAHASERFTCAAVRQTVSGLEHATIRQFFVVDMWHSRCDNSSSTMTSVTALLIVLSLTGTPVANAACASWCDSAAMTCCDVTAMPMTATLVDGSCTCVAAMSDTPVVREESRGARHAAVVAVLPPPLVSTIKAPRPAAVVFDPQALVERSLPTLVLRL